MTKRIVFDLGNVLFPLEYQELEDWLKTTVEVYDPNFKNRFDELYVNYEAGQLDTQMFFKTLRTELKMQFEDETFRQKWISLWKRDHEDVHQLLYELKEKGHLLTLLSNTNEMHMNEYLKTRPVLQIFDHAYYSYELKLAKPHVEIYHKVQSLMGVEAKQIIFFDDKPDNVEGAISAGWNAYVFTDAEEVRTQLEQLECF